MTRKIMSLILCLCMLFCLCACTFEDNPKNPNSVTATQKTEISSELVWIPTNVGRKYHKNSYCSNMKNPIKVTKEEAIKNGFGPCKNCY